MVSYLLSRLILLVFGTLYPAYASYKAVKTKNVKEYVKWMMYWIVFAMFTFVEMLADLFIAFWLPFYYELKILFVLWLTCPATKGSSFVYKRIVHPQLNQHEQRIDEYIARIWDQGYAAALQIGTHGFNYILSVLTKTLQRGQITVINNLPKIVELSQGVQLQSEMPPVQRNQVTIDTLDGEFDILSLDTEDVDANREIYQLSRSRSRSQDKSSQSKTMQEDSDVWSDDDDTFQTSADSRPLKVIKSRPSPKKSSYSEVSGSVPHTRSGRMRQRKNIKK